MTNDLRQRVADAMEAKRQELIAKPLGRIWPDLADAAIAAMPGWRPIEEAPKDGREFLIAQSQGRPVRVGFWDSARGGVWSIWPGREAAIEPTHFMTLSLPPHPEGE